MLSVRFECTENLSLGDELLQYFCGDEDVCRAHTEATYRQARRNLDSYVFVGLTEHFMISLQVLERLLPAFFRDARRAFERGAAASAGRGMSVGTATRAKMTAPYEDLSWSAARLLLEHPQNRWELQLWRDIETRFWQTVAGCGVVHPAAGGRARAHAAAAGTAPNTAARLPPSPRRGPTPSDPPARVASPR